MFTHKQLLAMTDNEIITYILVHSGCYNDIIHEVNKNLENYSFSE
jgi:hypothetical protein